MGRAIVFPFQCTDTTLERVTEPPVAVSSAYADFSARSLPLGQMPKDWASLTGTGTLSTTAARNGTVVESGSNRFVRFGASAAYNFNSATNSKPRTWFIRFRLPEVRTGEAFLSNIYPSLGISVFVQPNGNFGIFAGSSIDSGVAADTSWHTIVAVFNGTSSVLRVDGVETAGNSGGRTKSGFRVGAGFDGTYYPIEVARVGFTTTAADAAKRASIESAIK